MAFFSFLQPVTLLSGGKWLKQLTFGVEIPLHNGDGDGVAVNPWHILVRNQAIEDDALVYLTSAQAAGWRTELAA